MGWFAKKPKYAGKIAYLGEVSRPPALHTGTPFSSQKGTGR